MPCVRVCMHTTVAHGATAALSIVNSALGLHTSFKESRPTVGWDPLASLAAASGATQYLNKVLNLTAEDSHL